MSSLEITVRFNAKDAGFGSVSKDVLGALREIRAEARKPIRQGGFVRGGRGGGGGGYGVGGGYGGGGGRRGAVTTRRSGRRRRRQAGSGFRSDAERDRLEVDRIIRSGPRRRDADPIRDLDRAGARVHHTGLAMERAAQRSGQAMMALVNPTIEYERSITDAVAVVGDALSGPDAKKNEDRLRALSASFADVGVNSIDAAKSIEFFGMANFSTGDIEKNLGTTFQLARAGHTDTALAADLQTDIATAFYGEKGAKDNMGKTADVLTSTFTTANTNLRLLGSTLLTVGPIARQAGIDLEQTSGAAAVLAGNGIKGSKAGTDMRMMLLKLQNPTKAARKEWRRLGLDFQDVSDRLAANDLAGGLKLVHDALEKKGDGFNRARFFGKAFGSRPSGSTVKLVEAAGDGSLQEKIATARASQGLTAEVAGKKLGSDAAKMDIAKAKLIKVATTLGHTLLPELIPVAEGFVEVAQGVAEFSKNHPGAIKGLTKLVVVMTATTGILGPLVTSFGGIMRMGALMQGGLGAGGLGGTMGATGATASKLTGSIGKLSAGLGAAGLAGAVFALTYQVTSSIDEIFGITDFLAGIGKPRDEDGRLLAKKRGAATLSKEEHAEINAARDKIEQLEAEKIAGRERWDTDHAGMSLEERQRFMPNGGGINIEIEQARREALRVEKMVADKAMKREVREDAEQLSQLRREAGVIDAAHTQADTLRQESMMVRGKKKRQELLGKADFLDQEADYREQAIQRILEKDGSRLLPQERTAEGKNVRGSWRGALEVNVNTTTGQTTVTQSGRPIGAAGVQIPM